MDSFDGRQKGWPDYSWVIPGVIGYLPNYNVRKNDFKIKRNFRSQKHPYKRHLKQQQKQNFVLGQKRKNYVPPKPKTPPVDVEEEERKKKLSDTANKLLCKLKSWSAEGCANESSSKTESNPKPSEGKPKRIAHSKSLQKLGKKPVVKSKEGKKKKKAEVNSEKYDVNKATVKNFQNRIQQKLINEIMKMPKESLQNVLNDPKINPIMELKMSRLVKENKLVIAQRLRAIAEAKMSSQEFASSSQLLDDIDKLIDPVIETDLSVLPCQLIKQMENIFQVQFDYPANQGNPNQESEEGSNVETSKEEDLEDRRVYECSTDEDEEECSESTLELNEIVEVPKEDFMIDWANENNPSNNFLNDSFIKRELELNENLPSHFSTELECKFVPRNDGDGENQMHAESSKSSSPCFGSNSCGLQSPINSENDHVESLARPTCFEGSFSQPLTTQTSTPSVSKEPATNISNLQQDRSKPVSSSAACESDQHSPKQFFNTKTILNVNPLENPQFSEGNKKKLVCETTKNLKTSNQSSLAQSPVMHLGHEDSNLGEFSQNSCMQPSTSLQSKTAETQTESSVSEFLYGVSVPKQSTDESPESLLQEVESIQHLITKLNERRFMIFLKLAKTNQSGNFWNNESVCSNFVESLSNGSVGLLELLKKCLI